MSTFIAWMSFRPNRISPSEVIALSGSLVERAGGGLPDEGGHHKQSDAILGSPRLSEALRCTFRCTQMHIQMHSDALRCTLRCTQSHVQMALSESTLRWHSPGMK